MTDADVQDFVTRFSAAWAAGDGEAFLALWHPDGVLHSPFDGRKLPDLVWQLLDWTARGDVVVIEWQTTRTAGGKRFDFRGVDKFKLRDGKIVEERVYADTGPLRAMRSGQALEPLIAV
jgi:ketosteroid isomerase-like protein